MDAFTDEAYGPVYECPVCLYSIGSIEGNCNCPSHPDIQMIEKKGYMRSLSIKDRYYYILKTGDYASGWLKSGISSSLDKEHSSCKDKDLDRKWAEFIASSVFRKPETVGPPRKSYICRHGRVKFIAFLPSSKEQVSTGELME